ncbi:hypothetical protein P8452_02079 [Trifolium repens]|nr:hypothetical protein P8452_02079 [Trifolium repens]
MNEEGWKYLTDRWKEDEFKTRSERNKTNRASSKGGALHTTGRKAHHDIALDMNAMLGRPVHPDELFMATHKKRNGEWVDRRSEKTHPNHSNPAPYSPVLAPPASRRNPPFPVTTGHTENGSITPSGNAFIDFIREIVFGDRDIRWQNVGGCLFSIAISLS